jgi:hypothetical protein
MQKDGAIVLLGGNQGDAVSYKSFPAARIMGYRWPNEIPIPLKIDMPKINDIYELSTNEA